MAENDKFTTDGLYVGEIQGGLKPSMKLTVMGRVNQQPKSIAVNLACSSKDPETDVGLQLSVSFQDRSVARNARVCGEWGAAEKNIPYFPFSAGETFKIFTGEALISVHSVTALSPHRYSLVKP
ncbi:UNVERIFIED_CONTAM: hypothetical protein FKN15_049162 [Acipenser sinensis]